MKKILETVLNVIPEQYVYTSHKNNEYIFSSGKWYSTSGKEVEAHKQSKVTESAIKQIKMKNNDSVLKIGQHYSLNENEYTYIGDGKFTLDNKLLSESDSNSVLSGFLKEDDDSVVIPDYFIYTAKSGNRFMKKGDTWINLQTKKPVNSSNVNTIVQASTRFIENFNNSNPVKIGTKYTSNKGKDYFFNGTAFVSPEGKSIPASAAEKILSNLAQKSASAEEPDVQPERPEQSRKDDAPEQVNTDSTQESSTGLDGLAERIKSNPKRSKIITLLGRGDKISVLAAEILLDAKEQEAIKIINDLK